MSLLGFYSLVIQVSIFPFISGVKYAELSQCYGESMRYVYKCTFPTANDYNIR